MNLKNFYRKSAIFFASLILGLFLYSNSVSAQAVYNSLVNIPGITSGAGVTTYLSGLYTFLISVVGIVAMGAIIIGGARYLTSVGNPSAIEDAKHIINSAIIGLILALISWVAIWEINPDILVLKNPAMPVSGGKYVGGAKTPQCALAGGSGTSGCACIDGSVIKGTSAALTPTQITLSVSPNPATTTPPGNNVTFSGRLTTVNGAPISGVQVEINTINHSPDFDASTTVKANTDGSGNFTYNFTTNCATGIAADVKIQAVFAGNPTYAGTGSSPVQFVVNGFTSCTILNYSSPPLPLATLWVGGSGSECHNICSNATLASDGKYHCIKAGVKMGFVPNPLGLTNEQMRALAIYSGSNNNPFTAYNNSYYVLEMEKYTQSLYPIKEYKADKGYDGNCDDFLTDFGWDRSTAVYNVAPPGITCNNSADYLICSQIFCVEDSMGNKASTLIYYRIMKP